MSDALLLSDDTSCDADRYESDGTLPDDGAARPVRGHVDLDWLIEPDPGETRPRPGSTRGIAGVLLED